MRILLLFGLAMTVTPALAHAQAIRLVDAEMTSLPEQRYTIRIEATAEGEGIEVGSFYVALPEWAPMEAAPELPGFTVRNSLGHPMLTSHDFGAAGPNHADNGQIDEDPETGVFAVTLDTSTWPDGVYTLSAGAHNRPATGNYIVDREVFTIRVGDVEVSSPRELENAPDAEHRVIYKRKGVYACFPDLHVRPDGSMTTSFGTRVRATHIDTAGGSATLVSKDGGYTWLTAEDPVVDQRWVVKGDRLVTANARGWVQVPAERREELEDAGKRVNDVRPGTVAYLGGAYSRESLDFGETWSKEAIEVPSNVRGLMFYTKTAAETVTDEGTRLIAIYGRRKGSTGAGGEHPNEVFLLRSTDDGQNWTCKAMYPEGLSQFNLPVGFNETALVQVEGGRLLAVMRTEPAGEMYQAFSDDQGQTWSEPTPSGVWGYPAHLLQLSDGRVLMSYGYRRKPMGIRACISHDGGRTWDVDNEVILRADGFRSPGDLGYPLTHELPDGKLITIYYLTTSDGITHIASTHWNAPGPQE